MRRHPDTPPIARRTPSMTANVELADGPRLIGAFGDYVRWANRPAEVEPAVEPEAAAA